MDYAVGAFAERQEAMGFFCQFFQLRIGAKATIAPEFETAPDDSGKAKTFYIIECQIGDGNIWTVKKRFSEVAASLSGSFRSRNTRLFSHTTCWATGVSLCSSRTCESKS